MAVNNGLKFLNVGCKCHAENATDAWEYWYKELQEQAQNGFRAGSRDGEVVGEFINAITIIDDPTKKHS